LESACLALIAIGLAAIYLRLRRRPAAAYLLLFGAFPFAVVLAGLSFLIQWEVLRRWEVLRWNWVMGDGGLFATALLTVVGTVALTDWLASRPRWIRTQEERQAKREQRQAAEAADQPARRSAAVAAQPVFTADGAQAIDAEGRPLFTAPVMPSAAPPAAGTNPMAVVALVLGILGVTVLPIIFGHLARAQIRRTGQAGAGVALAGLILGYVTTVIAIGLLIFFLVIASKTSTYY